MSLHKGADFTERSDIAALKANGMTFVTRYLSRYTWKVLQGGEYGSLKNAGIDLVLNFEDGTNDSSGGYVAGAANASFAMAQAASRGVPGPYKIIFSLDSQYPANAVSYAHGAASVLGWANTGIYGGYDTIKAIFDGNACKYGWQTYAWSGGRWDSRAQLRQVQNGIMGGRWDLDYAQVDDFGQVGSVTVTGVSDVLLSDPVPGTNTPDYGGGNTPRSVGLVLMDLWRDVHIGAPLANTLANVLAMRAEEAAEKVVIQSLVDAIKAGGGSVDVMPILAAIAELKASTHADVTAQLAKLAAAAKAEADSLGGV